MTGYQWQAFAETQPDCMRDFVRTMNDLVDDYIDDESCQKKKNGNKRRNKTVEL